tara:strand:- start:5895 stop:7550 length:1656 start_codon:yes stop_codon:yes gene_type:complete
MSAKKLRELFETPGLIKIMGAHNALSAKLIEECSFDGVWASGFEISTAHCVPDANILTMSDFLAASESMADAIDIPVVADVDTGYGNSNNVMQMVKKFEAAGVAAVCMEDKHFPKVNSFIAGRQELAPISEFVGKIMAAKSVQKSKDFMVIARVEALIAGHGMEEALKRAKAYASAGADAILIHSKSKTPDEILEFIEKWDENTPLVIVPTTYHTLLDKEIEETKKVKMVIYANHGMRASMAGMKKVFKQIKDDGRTTEAEKWIAPKGDMFEIQGMHKMKELEKKYLVSGDEKVNAIILAAGDHSNEESLKYISKEIPMCMLDIKGKPLLQRQIEVLNKAKVFDITTVTGYKKEKINVEGTKYVNNENYANTGILQSIMQAEEQLSEKTVIAFSDVLFNKEMIEQLSKVDEDIVLLVGKYDKEAKSSDQIVDLVVTDATPSSGRRQLDVVKGEVKEISTTVDKSRAQYEFSGILGLSKKGAQIIKEVYQKAKEEFTGKQFNESESFERANLNSLLQEVMKKGHTITFLESNMGWSEIHSFEDYKEACAAVQ